jgi:uncharacterized protein
VKVWIDLSNSPHPLLFTPIRVAFEEEGHTVLMTARDNAQTLELARQRWPDVKAIGGRSPGGRIAKARALASRAHDLFRWARAVEPDVALSHNSYAQILAARLARIPVVTRSIRGSTAPRLRVRRPTANDLWLARRIATEAHRLPRRRR